MTFNEEPGPIAPPTDEDVRSGPFRVELDEGGCPHCGKGKTWVIVDEDGDAILGQSWGPNEDGECPSEPQEVAEGLNWAYALGLQAAATNPPQPGFCSETNPKE